MSGMSDDDGRSWAEKRIDDRRAEQGLPATGSATTGRLITAVLLAALGLWLVTQSDNGLGIGIGVVALGGAGYQFLVAAIARGVSEGHDKTS